MPTRVFAYQWKRIYQLAPLGLQAQVQAKEEAEVDTGFSLFCFFVVVSVFFCHLTVEKRRSCFLGVSARACSVLLWRGVRAGSVSGRSSCLGR